MFYKLKSFKILAETKSFTETAKRLSITQPAVSQHLKFLQNEFRDELIQKINSNIILTPKGERIYHAISNSISSFDLSLEEIKANKIKSTLKIMGPLNFLNYKLIPYLAKNFSDNIFFQLSFGNSMIANESLLGGKIDLAIVSRPLGTNHVSSKIIFEEKLLLVANKKYADVYKKKKGILKLADMSVDLRLYTEWENSNQIKLLNIDEKPELVASIASIEGLYQYVLHHACAVVMPEHMVKNDLGKKLVSLYPEADHCVNRLYLCKLKRKRDSETNQMFKKLSSF